MITEDCEDIIRQFPEMILVSTKPVTWRGFLPVSSNSNSGQNIRIKLKLTLPNYPSLNEVEFNFGKEITFIRNYEFRQRLKDLGHNVTKVSSFLMQLQLLIGNIIQNDDINTNVQFGTIDYTEVEILEELKDVLNVPSEIEILSDSTLNVIMFRFKNVSVKLQRAKFSLCPWTVIQSDLPDIPAFEPFEKNLSTLNVVRSKFKTQVDILANAWMNLEQIDENCWVIDPPQPKPCHLYRRIYLTECLSMFIKIDPLNTSDLPEIKFMGSEIEVESKREHVSKNLHHWNPKCDIINNLLLLLEIDSFPRKIEEEYTKDDNAIVADEECCICFSSNLEDGTLSDKVCSNQKCRRHFHTICLLQWLQAVAGNHIVFDHIYGSCPNCQESISCCIK